VSTCQILMSNLLLLFRRAEVGQGLQTLPQAKNTRGLVIHLLAKNGASLVKEIRRGLQSLGQLCNSVGQLTPRATCLGTPFHVVICSMWSHHLRLCDSIVSYTVLGMGRTGADTHHSPSILQYLCIGVQCVQTVSPAVDFCTLSISSLLPTPSAASYFCY
jgi:hypothetical protein